MPCPLDASALAILQPLPRLPALSDRLSKGLKERAQTAQAYFSLAGKALRF
ncbi:MAG: hypothetical protein JWN79_1527, partial [Gemmatimonadetes bacterium]|nr:hypothetical protein [Gemmatimonadota bacterium]